MVKIKQFILTAFCTCLLVLTILRVNAATLEFLPEQAELFQQVLTAAKLTPAEVKLDLAEMRMSGDAKYRFNLLDVFFDNPWKISAYTRSFSDQLLNISKNLSLLTFIGHKRMDGGIAPQLKPNLLDKYKQQAEKLGTDALAVALNKLTNQRIESFKTAGYQALPSEVKTAVAQFLLTVPDILNYRKLGLLQPIKKLQLDGEQTYKEVLDYVVTTVEEEEKDDIDKVLLVESLLDNVDFKLLNTGAIIAVSASEALQKQLSQLKPELLAGKYDYSIDTPQGRIIISGQGNRTYPANDYLLIVDVAGNDTYAGGAATRNLAHGLSVTIDLAGSDRYSSPSNLDPSFGAGIFGYGILIDVQGDDQYQGQYQSQGVGLFGTGVLADTQGNDTYQGLRYLQGAGTFGTGLLVDYQGSDKYYLYSFGQGYGFTKGVGMLIDSTGDDQYIGLEDKYPNGGPFGADKHIHFAQGAAFGRRGESTDGHNWAGGMGILVDGAGSDRYECEIYGQGTAYWYGLGLLVDKAGDDYYDAGAYSLGGSPHFAIGVLQDDAGNDHYTGVISQSLGKGRDWSIGWFEDSAGNDWYQGHHALLGSADINGIGVFWDRQGNDTYLSTLKSEPAYGQSSMAGTSGLRELMFTLGLFVDGDGQDQYLVLPENLDGEIKNIADLPANSVAKNNYLWCRPTVPKEFKRAFGCGLDAPTNSSN